MGKDQKTATLTAMAGAAAYWRGVVASAADVTIHAVTQFSPDGFSEWLGQRQWWSVDLGPLRLRHDGSWVYAGREDDTEVRKTYAHRSWREALAALRQAVSPDDPACAEVIEAVYGKNEAKDG